MHYVHQTNRETVKESIFDVTVLVPVSKAMCACVCDVWFVNLVDPEMKQTIVFS